MKRRVLFAIVASCASLGMAACGRDQPPVEEGATQTEGSSRVDQAVETLMDAPERAGEGLSATTEPALDEASPKAGRVSSMAGAAVEEVIREVKDSLAEDRGEMARDLMDELVAMKDSLPVQVREEIERLASMFPDR